MQPSQSSTTAHAMNQFTEAVCSAQPVKVQLHILSRIKRALIINPNNYYHPYFGRASFPQIYEFIIECMSRQHQPPVLNFLLHVLALMAKHWVLKSEDLKCLYEGVLSLFQQKSFCCENCFKFFAVLVETMQQQDVSDQSNNRQVQPNYSCMPFIRAALQNYFVNHLLNQMLAFANIFLDRSVVRNEQIGNKNNGSNEQKQVQIKTDDHSSSKLSRSMDNSHSKKNLPHEASFTIEDNSEECELYKIEQPQSVILSILNLTRACLSYDFSQTSRHWQESDYQPNKSPIILPTKYSKHCKFSEFDVFLKNENTTELLNYLFLVCNLTDLKLEVLRILQSMARIHFRYFKNKTLHKVHLEDIGYAVANLLTGLDLNQPISVSVRSRSSKSGGLRSISMDPNSKLKLALSLGQTLNILLYHQPTFYLAQYNLFQLILEHVSAFVVEELLDPDNFGSDACIEGVTGNISRADICLLVENYMSHLPKLKGYFKSYVTTSENLQERLNEMLIKIGEKYFMVLCLQCDHSQKQKQTNKYDANLNSLGQRERGRPELNNSNENASRPEDIQNKSASNAQKHGYQSKIMLRQPDYEHDRKCGDEEKDETQTNWNIVIKNKPQLSQKNTSRQNFRENRPKNNQCFIQSIVKQDGSIQICRSLLAFFRAYCPRHTYLTKDEQVSTGIRPGITNCNSDISYASEGSCRERLSSIFKQPLVSTDCNYQKWLTSWLCSFEHHFNVTAAHSRLCQQWELDLHLQLMKQLVQDLHVALIKQGRLAQLDHQDDAAELGQCIETILLYLTDKVVYDSRFSVQEYLMSIELRVDLIIFFVCGAIVGTDTRRNYEINKKTALQPVADMLDTINFNDYFLPLKQVAADQHQKSLESYCLNLSQLVKQNVAIDGMHEVISKMLYVHIKMSTHFSQLNSVNINRLLERIFQSSPSILLYLLTEVERSSGHRFRSESEQIYKLYLQDKVVFDVSLLRSLTSVDHISNYLSYMLVFIRVEKRVGQLFAHKQLVAKNLWNHFLIIEDLLKQNKSNPSSCNCNLYLNPLIQVTKQLCSLSPHNFGQAWSILFAIMAQHTQCLITIDLAPFAHCLKDSLSLIPNSVGLTCLRNAYQDFNNGDQELNSNKNWYNFQIFLQSCIWVFKVLSLCRGIYSREEPKLAKLERQIMSQLYDGYDKHEGSHIRSGLLWQLSHFITKEDLHAELKRAVNDSLSLILSETLKYLLQSMHEEVQMNGLIEAQHNEGALQKCSFLKVDNIIEVFSHYHHWIEAVSESHPVLLETIVDSAVVRDCIKFCKQFGVGWVVRKLENWNNSDQLDSFDDSKFEAKQMSYHEEPKVYDIERNSPQNTNGHEKERQQEPADNNDPSGQLDRVRLYAQQVSSVSKQLPNLGTDKSVSGHGEQEIMKVSTENQYQNINNIH